MDDERNNFYKVVLDSTVNSDGVIDLEYNYEIFCDDENHYERIIELSSKTNQMNFYKKPIIKVDKNINITH